MYFVVWLFDSAGCTELGSTVMIILNFILASNWLFFSMAEDITKDISAFNTTVEMSGNVQCKASFCDLIAFHTEAKKYLMESVSTVSF